MREQKIDSLCVHKVVGQAQHAVWRGKSPKCVTAEAFCINLFIIRFSCGPQENSVEQPLRHKINNNKKSPPLWWRREAGFFHQIICRTGLLKCPCLSCNFFQPWSLHTRTRGSYNFGRVASFNDSFPKAPQPSSCYRYCHIPGNQWEKKRTSKTREPPIFEGPPHIYMFQGRRLYPVFKAAASLSKQRS